MNAIMTLVIIVIVRDMPIRITFCLPGYAKRPTGGFKIIYEYANRLAQHHAVSVIHPNLLLTGSPWSEYPLRLAGWVLRQAKLSYGPGSWFSIHPRVQMLTVPSLHPRHIPSSDVVVATAWTTAEWVARYPASKGRKLYFVQDYEHLMTAPDRRRHRIMATYGKPFTMVVISPVLQTLLSRNHIECTLIPNALDDTLYRLNRPIDTEDRNGLGFPYRPEPYKGTQDVLAALSPLVDRYNLKGHVWTFGSTSHPQLPYWVTYHRHPSDHALSALYNRTKIFVVGSHFEGWGLPGMEAMACGAALVSTDHGGIGAYAQDGVNALLTPIRQPTQLRDRIESLLNDDTWRRSIAENGIQAVKPFTWERSTQMFEHLLSTVSRKQPSSHNGEGF